MTCFCFDGAGTRVAQGTGNRMPTRAHLRQALAVVWLVGLGMARAVAGQDAPATVDITPFAAPHSVALPAGDRDAAPRPRGLVPLYVSFAALEALDVHSSLRAIDRGAREANPLFAGLDRWPSAVGALKGGSFAAVVLLTEKMRRRHPKAALLTMIALNSSYCWIVAHNYRTVK